MTVHNKDDHLSLLSVAVSLPDGHVSVEHVELDIKEMLELGKKAATIHKGISSPTQMDSAGINRCVQDCEGPAGAVG